METDDIFAAVAKIQSKSRKSEKETQSKRWREGISRWRNPHVSRSATESAEGSICFRNILQKRKEDGRHDCKWKPCENGNPRG